MNINIEFVKNRAKEIRKNIALIKKLLKTDENAFFEDERNLYTLKHLLLECIETIASLCNHFLAKIGRRAPSSYSECFEGLIELDIVSPGLKDPLIKMARFRNLVFHKYWEIDDRKILLYGKENTKDFQEFLKEIGKYLKEKL